MVNFWKGKKVFLTGHTGFKGSWLTLLLKTLGAEVIGYSLSPSTTPSLFSLCRIKDEITHIIGDVRNFKKLQEALSSSMPDIVIHMAAQPLVRESYIRPLETYEVNVMGSIHILEAVRRTKSVRAFLNVTTDKCYENNETKQRFKEKDPLGGLDPYSSSKACSELATNAYRHSFFQEMSHQEIGIASARAGNVIGGGDWAKDRIIPDLIDAFMKNQNVIIRSPLAIRPWQHVLDLLWGYLTLIQHLHKNPKRYSEAWNFGPEEKEGKTVSWIVNKAIDYWGSKIQMKNETAPLFYEAKSLYLDSTKAIQNLGWSTSFNTEMGLETTLDWYKKHLVQKEDPKQLTLEQIDTYLNAIQKEPVGQS